VLVLQVWVVVQWLVRFDFGLWMDEKIVGMGGSVVKRDAET
jgi:hypothetical protein